jgi:DNA-directed RNA polymerase subunit delta
MKAKSENGKKPKKPPDSTVPEKSAGSRPITKTGSGEDDEDEDELSARTVSKLAGKDSDGTEGEGENRDEEDIPEMDDEWEKANSEDYDPDFEEFDLPKSKNRPGKKGKAGGEEDSDFEDELKEMDLFSDPSFEEEEDEDF